MSDSTETQTDFDLGGAVEPRHAVIGVVGLFSENAQPCAARGIDAPTLIGRDASHAHLVVDDGKVSRAHIELSPSPGGLLLRDLGSRNGSTLDGEPVKGTVNAGVGAVIRIGRTLLLVVADVLAHRRRSPQSLDAKLIGGPALDPIRHTVERIAAERFPVLITGETGTGKERVSKAIHNASGRPGVLVAINCAALPSELVESELFGHQHGAFSGSQQPRSGLFREAHRGTLLLDELGELPLAVQAKLLRVLEDNRVRPVGADRDLIVDVRVIAATNRELSDMVAEGRFREDLYHRLTAVRITLPPLRDRVEDIPALARSFCSDPALGFSVLAMERLCRAPWPGNVRELRHAVQLATVNARATGRPRIEPDHLPQLGLSQKVSPTPARAAGEIDVASRVRIETALQLCGGNVSRAGRDLGMGRSTLYEAMKRFNIDPTRYRR